MAVEFYKIRDSDLTMTDAAQTITFGENIPSGKTVESVILHITQTNAAGGMIAGSLDNCISAVRFVANGVPYTDFRAGDAVCDPANAGLGRWGYYLQSLGNNAVSVEVPSDTDKDYWAEVPMGWTVPQGVGRMEFILSFAAMTAAATSGTLEVWLRLNDATTTSTYAVPSTSFTAATGIQSVVVRVPQNVKGAVAGIMMQNTSANEDNIGGQGVRVHLLGAFGLEQSLLRYLNSDLSNGLKYAADGVSLTEQQFAISCTGATFIPLFNAVGGDIQLECDFTAGANGQNFTFQPIMVASLNGQSGEGTRQTLSAPSNTGKSILARTVE